MDIINCVKRDSKNFVVLTAVSKSSIPEGEYITFKAVFKDLDGNIVCKRTITDREGNAVQLSVIDQMVVLEYNFVDIEATYNGDNKPSDLKIYEF